MINNADPRVPLLTFSTPDEVVALATKLLGLVINPNSIVSEGLIVAMPSGKNAPGAIKFYIDSES